MPREAYVYKLILGYLERNPGLHSTKSIVEKTGISYPSVARVIAQLAKEKRVSKSAGQGHSFLYEFKSYAVLNKKKTDTRQYEAKPIAPSELQAISLNWVNNGWTPATIEAAQILLTALGQLFQFYWLSIERGLPVDQGDLDHLKTKLMSARNKAFKFAEFYDTLLATTQIWDARRSAEFVLDGLDNPLEYIETARNISGALKL